MKRFLLTVLLVMMVCACCMEGMAEGQIFSIQAVNVNDDGRIDVVIYDPQEGQLEGKDFPLMLDQTSVPIEAISSLQSADVGTTWVFVVDLSVLGDGKNLDKTKTILNSILFGDGTALGPRDNAGIFTTGMIARDIVLTNDQRVLRVQIDSLTADAKSKQLYAKTAEALNFLETGKDVQKRKVLVLLSNGVNETITDMKYDELTWIFKDTNTTVYTFALMMNTDKNRVESFNSLARYSTGGKYYTLTPSYDDMGDMQVQSLLSNEKLFRCITANPGREGIKGKSVSVGKTNNPNENDKAELAEAQQAQLSKAADEAIAAGTTPTPDPETPTPIPETETPIPSPEPDHTILGFSTVQIGLIAGAAILVIAIVLALIIKNKRKQKNAAEESVYDIPESKTEAAPQVPALDTLIVKLESVGTDEEKTYTSSMVDELIIGRVASKARLIVPDPKVSSANSKLSYENRVMFIEDLDSLNGTLLNGMKVTGKVVVHQQDVIRVGLTNLRISWDKAK